MVRTPAQVNPRSSAPAQRCMHASHPRSGAFAPAQRSMHASHLRSSAPAQHCIYASQMVKTPVEVHPLGTVSMPAKWSKPPLKCTRSALYSCQPNGKNPRSSQHCMHACQMVGTHASQMVEPPLKCTRSALYPCLPNGKNPRSSAPAQRCIHASQMARTLLKCTHSALYASQMVRSPAQVHPLSTVSMPAKWQEPRLKCRLFVSIGFSLSRER